MAPKRLIIMMASKQSLNPVDRFSGGRQSLDEGQGHPFADVHVQPAVAGPTGVLEKERGKGIGRALLLACLWGLREMGYAYAIIGGAGPVEFYQRECVAVVIPDSVPGVYHDPLKKRGKGRGARGKRKRTA